MRRNAAIAIVLALSACANPSTPRADVAELGLVLADQGPAFVVAPRLRKGGVGQVDGVVRQILEELGVTDSDGQYDPPTEADTIASVSSRGQTTDGGLTIATCTSTGLTTTRPTTSITGSGVFLDSAQITGNGVRSGNLNYSGLTLSNGDGILISGENNADFVLRNAANGRDMVTMASSGGAGFGNTVLILGQATGGDSPCGEIRGNDTNGGIGWRYCSYANVGPVRWMQHKLRFNTGSNQNDTITEMTSIFWGDDVLYGDEYQYEGYQSIWSSDLNINGTNTWGPSTEQYRFARFGLDVGPRPILFGDALASNTGGIAGVSSGVVSILGGVPVLPVAEGATPGVAQRGALQSRVVHESHVDGDGLATAATHSYHDNLGATQTVTLQLAVGPPEGTRYTFTQAAVSALRIEPGAGQAFRGGGIAAASFADGDYLELVTATTGGAFAEVVADSNGDWVITSWGGTLAAE